MTVIEGINTCSALLNYSNCKYGFILTANLAVKYYKYNG